MKPKVWYYLIVVNVIVISLFLFIACGGGGGGGIIPPIGGGSGGSGGGGGGGSGGGNLNPNQSSINSTTGAYIIFSTKGNSVNSNNYSFTFSTTQPNILSNQNEPTRQIVNEHQFKCGFKPSSRTNQNILYSTTAPNLGDTKNFNVSGSTVNATCRYVNNNPNFAIWVDDNDWNNNTVIQAEINQLALRFANDYNTLTTTAQINLSFYVDILITTQVDPSNPPSVIGYFWGTEDPQRVNIHPYTFTLNYGTYNEANVTLVHEFVHLLEFHGSSIGNHDDWIAEGLATYGEELCGYGGDVRINSIRYFLRNPDATPLVTNNPDFANYGKSFLFVKLLNQRFTNAWSNMVRSNLNGINLIENINGSEDFLTTVEVFNTAVILNVSGDNNFGFNNIDLNNIDRNGDNSGNDKGVFKYDESDNDGFENKTLSQMGAFSSISPYSAFYIYKTNSPFNGVVTFNAPTQTYTKLSVNLGPFNTLSGYTIDRTDTDNARYTVVYK